LKIKFEDFELNIETPLKLSSEKKYIFFLHGFTCSSTDWLKVINGIDKNYNPILIDLIGHGKSDSPSKLNYYKVNSQIKQIKKITEYFTEKKIILCGYSMGGRLALSFADKYPEKVKGLILESTMYGIKNETEREDRKKQDKGLAEYIKSNKIVGFVDHWLNKEIFSTLKKLPKEKYKLIIENKLKNNKIGLVNSLIGFGTGNLPCLLNNLKNLNFPILLITGELDKKFTKINQVMANIFPNAIHSIINNTGHSTHLENSIEFKNSINRFLSTL